VTGDRDNQVAAGATCSRASSRPVPAGLKRPWRHRVGPYSLSLTVASGAESGDWGKTERNSRFQFCPCIFHKKIQTRDVSRIESELSGSPKPVGLTGSSENKSV
jgi:hypothetical protein